MAPPGRNRTPDGVKNHTKIQVVRRPRNPRASNGRQSGSDGWENTSLETGRKVRRGVERVHCGVTFANVVKVQRMAIDRGRPGTFLNLLTISLVDRPDGEGPIIELTFSGDAAIRLETAALLCHLEDFGEPWPAQLQPQHAND